MRKRTTTIMLMVLGLFVAAGCAHNPPKQDIATAEFAIGSAEQSGAAELASLELRYAKDNLARARKAVQLEEYARAQRLADEALADAKLAEAKAQSAKAQQTLQELKLSIEELQEEIESMQTQ